MNQDQNTVKPLSNAQILLLILRYNVNPITYGLARLDKTKNRIIVNGGNGHSLLRGVEIMRSALEKAEKLAAKVKVQS